MFRLWTNRRLALAVVAWAVPALAQAGVLVPGTQGIWHDWTGPTANWEERSQSTSGDPADSSEDPQDAPLKQWTTASGGMTQQDIPPRSGGNAHGGWNAELHGGNLRFAVAKAALIDCGNPYQEGIFRPPRRKASSAVLCRNFLL